MTVRSPHPGQPPQLARWILRIATPRDDRAFLVADIDDEFAERAREQSPRLARHWYRAQVARSLAPLVSGRWHSRRRRAAAAPKGTGVMRVIRDLRFAFRSLAVSRAHTAVAVLTLAAGIGVNVAVFSILDSVLLRPLPFPQSDRLVRLWNLQLPQGFSYDAFSPAAVSAWRRQTDIVDRVEATASASFVYEAAGGASMASGAYVTPELFSLLGAKPLLGRVFAAGDGRSGSAHRAVIAETFWRRELAADRTVVGRRLRLNGDEFEIVGVVPAAFRYPTELQEIWVPYDVEQPPAEINAGSRFSAIARRRVDLTAAEAADRVKARGAGVLIEAGQPPSPQSRGTLTARAVNVEDSVDTRTRRSIWVLAGAVGFLLLIVCANVASLTLSRALARVRDFAVRSALGAARRDLIRATLIEQALIATAGAVAGAGVASLILRATTAALPESITMRAFNVVDLDLRALLFLIAASAVTLLLVCLPPVLIASRATVADVLRHESRSATGSTGARRLRSGLVVVEVALAMVLLVGAALMARSVIKLHQIDIGLDADGLVTTQIAMPQRGFDTESARDLFVDTLLARLRTVPEISAVAAGALPPHKTAVTYGPIERADRPGDLSKPVMTPAYEVSQDFFRAAGIRIVEGRQFAGVSAISEVVVSAGFAAAQWPGQKATGQRFRVGNGEWLTVAGVAAEVREMSEDDRSGDTEVYYPRGGLTGAMYATGATSQIAAYETILIRTARPELAAQLVARAVREVDARVVVARTTLAAHQFAQSIARPRIVLLLMSVFGAFGLVLAAGGIYGVLSCLVTQRLREIGVRLALGASPARVFRQILGSGMALTAIGLGAGVVLALALVRVMRSILYEVDASDPVSVLAVIALLSAAAAVAAWLPARRAMRVDPVSLLRES